MFKIGILGAGNIANKMAYTVGKMDGVEIGAVASRDIDKARAFAQKYNIKKAYGSYGELASDGSLDLIYVATPHGFHFEHTMLCLNAGRNVLCEKPFMINAEETKEVFKLAEEKISLPAKLSGRDFCRLQERSRSFWTAALSVK